MIASSASHIRRAYHAGVAVAAGTSLLTLWSTVVRDDGNGIGPFMLVMAAIVGAVAGRFRADGLARAMAGVAAMQVMLALLIATAPTTATAPGGPVRVLASGAVLTGLWLLAAVLFSAADRAGPTDPTR